MSVFQYPALNDNYNWIITCPETGKCAGVDIFDSGILFNYINEHDLELVAILNTHHHMDHVGGNQEIFKKYPDIKFYGSKYDYENKRIACQNISLSEGDTLFIGNIKISVLEIPGHTLGHICLYNNDFSFVGDTLFASGCGKLFEGTAKQMFLSHNKLIDNLEPSKPIYCGHEYTLSNLKFACSLNQEYFDSYYNKIASLREQNKMTVPTNLETELKLNPFLMVRDEKLKNEILNMENLNPEEAFATLRKMKDNF
jgi:hydroxyacylglutathione hydrolase